MAVPGPAGIQPTPGISSWPWHASWWPSWGWRPASWWPSSRDASWYAWWTAAHGPQDAFDEEEMLEKTARCSGLTRAFPWLLTLFKCAEVTTGDGNARGNASSHGTNQGIQAPNRAGQSMIGAPGPISQPGQAPAQMGNMVGQNATKPGLGFNPLGAVKPL